MLFTEDSKHIFITYALIICTIDTFAMFGGRTIGGPKLAPKISPNKTFAGLFVGVVASMAIVQLLTFIPNYYFPYQGWSLSIFAAILSIIAQASDLFISYFKRHFGLKDTGNLIPGHGGILDRFDSVIFTAPILVYVVL
jgi:phosphatidate cytidylyltransferase